MREIKFRCWDKENKEMLEVQELDYADSYDGQPMVRTTMYNDYFDTEDMILMQYTGLKDKNGTEIYEGDVVKLTNGGEIRIAKVIYEYCGFTIDITNMDKPYGRVSFCMPEKYIEVIGNVWEDSDLLNDSKNTKSN